MKVAQLFAALAAAVALLAGAPAQAQAKYPSKNIEVVVPFAPGGGTDNMMRMITAIIDENKWSPMPMNVNNRAGGSGTVGFSYLISKKGDSHVIAGATPMIVSGKLQGRLPGNHRDAMTVLMIVAIDELMLSVRTDSCGPESAVVSRLSSAQNSSTRFLPVFLARYSARSARRTRSSAVLAPLSG